MKHGLNNKHDLEKIYNFDFILTASVIVLLVGMVLYSCFQLFMS